jgi:hypothetical protein
LGAPPDTHVGTMVGFDDLEVQALLDMAATLPVARQTAFLNGLAQALVTAGPRHVSVRLMERLLALHLMRAREAVRCGGQGERHGPPVHGTLRYQGSDPGRAA